MLGRRLILMIFAIAACIAFAAKPSRVAASEGDRLRVVTSMAPIHSLVAGVMAGVGEPKILLPGGASPHAYALRPSQAKSLAEADVVFWIGPELERFLTQPLRRLAVAARTVALGNAPGLIRYPVRGKRDQGQGGGGQEGVSRGTSASEAASARDLHLWLDDRNARAMVHAIADALSKAAPQHAAAFRRNGRRVAGELDRLGMEVSARLKPFRDIPFVMFHDAFQYFERRFGLRSVGVVALDADRRPGPRHLRRLQGKIRADAVRCVFVEPQFPPNLVHVLIDGTNAKTGILDPLGSGLMPGPDLYFRLMRKNAEAVARCLRAGL